MTMDFRDPSFPTRHRVGRIHRSVIFLLASLPLVSPLSLSPCADPSARGFDLDTCLEAIKTEAEDRHKYWFGDTYKRNCANRSEFVAECFNPYASHEDSIVSRIFRRRFYNRDKLNTFLKVTFETYTGRYEACGHSFTITESRTVEIDPLNHDEDLKPFQLLMRPSITWKESTPDSLHTLAIYDAGYVTVKALYINVPGSDLEMGQTVVPYEPPLNPTLNKNPYVFLLFLQADRIDLSPKWLHRLSRRDESQFEDFLAAFNLEGPVGLSWFTVRSDPYSAEVKRSRGYMNTCARFVDKAFKSKDLAFLTPANDIELSVYIDVSFESRALKIDSCCHQYSYPAASFIPNPLGDEEVSAALVRTGTKHQVHFTKSTAFPDRARDFKGQMHAFVVVDLAVPPEFGSPERPFIHWLVVNIKEGDLSAGEEILNYLGPTPPHGFYHTYYFLLFEQIRELRFEKGDYSFRNCSPPFDGRCGFDMNSLIQDGGLKLEGATWMLVKMDEYVRHFYVELGMSEEDVCSAVPGYLVGCGYRDGEDNSAGSGSLISRGLWHWLVLGHGLLYIHWVIFGRHQ